MRGRQKRFILRTGKAHWNRLCFLIAKCCDGFWFCLVVFEIKIKGNYRGITVDDGDVPAFVVLRQGHGGSLRRGHDPHGAACVGALQVGRGAHLGRLHGQALGQAEGVPRAVPAVGLVPPLHHRRLGGGRLVLTREDHRLEEHGVALLLPHGDVHAIARAHCGRDDGRDELKKKELKLDSLKQFLCLTSGQNLRHFIIQCILTGKGRGRRLVHSCHCSLSVCG